MNIKKAVVSALIAVMSFAAYNAAASDRQWPAPTPPEIREAKLKNVPVPNRAQLEKIEAAAPAEPPAKPAKPRKALVWGHPWTHGPNVYAEEALKILGRKSGAFDATVSDDPGMLLPGKLNEFDVLIMNNIHEGEPFLPLDFASLPQAEKDECLRVDRAVKESILEYVSSGKGIAGIHAATCALQKWKEYGEMMGGYYAGHILEPLSIKPDDPDNPINAAFGGKPFDIHDEIYIFGEPYSRESLRILLSLDLDRMRDPGSRPDKDYAISWVRKHNQGRVFYTTLGHCESSYSDSRFLAHVLAGIQFAIGDLPAETMPSAWNTTSDKFDLAAMEARLKDAGPSEKAAILRSLPAYAGKEASQIFKEALKDQSPAIRLTALRAVSRIKGADVVETLVGMLDDKDVNVRVAAVNAIGRLGDVSSVPILAEAACSVNGDVRDAARSSLAFLPGAGVDDALRELAAAGDESPESRAEAIRALAARGVASAAPELFKTARDKDKTVRMAGLSALGKLAEAKTTPDLIALVKDAGDDDERCAAADALALVVARAGAPDAELGLVVSTCGQAEPALRKGLLRSLRGIGGEKALAPVRAALRDKDAGVSAAALQAMSEWPDAAPIDDLLEIAGGERSEADKALALAGHVRMIGLKTGLSPADKCAMYEAAMDLAERDAEKLRIYRGLAATPDLKTLTFLEQCIEEIKAFGDDKLLPEAEKAYVDAAISLSGSQPGEVKEALMKFCGESNNKDMVERAGKAVQNIDK